MIRSVLTLILTFGCILSLPSYAAGNFGRTVTLQEASNASSAMVPTMKLKILTRLNVSSAMIRTQLLQKQPMLNHKIRMFHLTMVKTWIACYATCSTAKPKTIVSSVTTSGLRFRNLSV